MRRFIFLLPILIVLFLSCNLPLAAPPATPAPTSLPPSTDAPILTPTTNPYSSIVHTAIPGSPVLTYYAYDCNTGRYTPAFSAPEIGSGCNLWQQNVIEKPINEQRSLYYPHLDIVHFQMGADEEWLYAQIQLYGSDGAQTALSSTYGLELDFDLDGQGELLVMAVNPMSYPSGGWHTGGVEIWQDMNNDVGGHTLIFADDDNPGDGYETQLFDQGLGSDPDMAWARIPTENSSIVEFAIKSSTIPTDRVFLWWAWASQERLDPALFDYVDTFSDSQVFQIENTCRWIFNGPPQPLPNLCPYEYEAEKPDRPDKPKTTEPPKENYCVVTEYWGNIPLGSACVVCPTKCPKDFTCRPVDSCPP